MPPTGPVAVQHLVFTVQADANSYASQCDAALGYPRTGVNIGGGQHGPSTSTTKRQKVLTHPTLPLWAYLAAPDIQALPVVVPITGAVQTIDPVAWGLATAAQVG